MDIKFLGTHCHAHIGGTTDTDLMSKEYWPIKCSDMILGLICLEPKILGLVRP
jgi:hypothetical protein